MRDSNYIDNEIKTRIISWNASLPCDLQRKQKFKHMKPYVQVFECINIKGKISTMINYVTGEWEKLHCNELHTFIILEIFLFTTAPRPALGPTQPPLQRIPGVKRPGREADRSPPSSAEVKNAWLCTSTPNTSSWRGA